jgi:S-adenosylmethionine hydrolase/sugar lactone lactonase YvrE
MMSIKLPGTGRAFRPGNLILGLGFLSLASSAQQKIVVFQSDFGLKDGAVSAMKGVAMGVSPDLKLFDLTHEIPAYNIWEAAYRLQQTVPYWPAGTVFVSVVDPGVGTNRKSVVLKTKTGQYIVSPDNGTLTLIAESQGIAEIREINEAVNRRKDSRQSYTFHGRDVYAYTGARLAAGVIRWEEVGPLLVNQEVVSIPYQKAVSEGKKIKGTIAILDVQYGNIWTNIGEDLFQQLNPTFGDTLHVVLFHNGSAVYEGDMPYFATFGAVPVGKPLAYLNSLLQLSFAVNQGDFAAMNKIGSGAEWGVEVEDAGRRSASVHEGDSSPMSVYDTDSILGAQQIPRLISRQFSFTEGASVDHHGNIFFTDQPNNKIWEYGLDGQLKVFLDSAGRSNGMYFDGKGNLVTCADEQDQLWAISPAKKIRVLLRDFHGHRLNGPNDLWIDAKGGIYFTDPYYQRPYWTRDHPDLNSEDVYYLPEGKHEPMVAASGLAKPNGIVGTPDGRYLYVSDISGNKTYKYRIGVDGALTDRELFVSLGSDGMTLDERGDVYLTGNGVTVYDPAGKKIAHIPVPEKWTANLCFGGRDRKTLFITASESLYMLPMRVKGVE